ncbi:hypothetical protein CC78DRAFT_535228 [Lojkania enalia]|uniref:Uncharacterized protein n=1 Tax=Lojkania enalia TaxID=147567 RepID=A0A9P4K663_9PLEO|nr:hypothetical protein CC78DRAFT_535228 [Didymosphaeria enalia]
MRSFILFVAAIALPSYTSALPTGGNVGENLPRPNFEGKFPESINITKAELRARQFDPFDPPNCADRVYETATVGNGSPKDWTRWKQISQPIWCNGGQCMAGISTSTSYTLGFDASMPLNRWVTGGFSVSASYSTGNNYECTGDSEKGHKKVCIWAYKGHTAYTVKNIDYPMNPRCGGKSESRDIRVTSPLSDEHVKGYWCGYNEDCHDMGYEEWTENHYPN